MGERGIGVLENNGYEVFLRNLGSVTLGLVNCAGSIDREFYWDLRNKKRRQDEARILSANYKLDRVGANFFDVSADFRVTVQDRKIEKVALSIECKFEAHIHGEEPISREHADRFTQSELRVVLWPYFRQFVSDTTVRMSVPPLFVPIALGKGGDAVDVRAMGGRRRSLKGRGTKTKR